MANPKTYVRPTTLKDALSHLQKPDTVALVGGALLLTGLDSPYDTVVDLQAISALQTIDIADSGITFGGGVTLQQVTQTPGVADVVKQAVTRTIPLNRRNAIAIHDSLITEKPPREWLAALVALDVSIHYRTSDGETHARSFRDLLKPGGLALKSAIVESLTIAQLKPGQACAAFYVSRTPADQPIVNAAVRVEGDQAVIGLCGASTDPVIALTMTFSDETLDTDIETILEPVAFVGDYLGSIEYRREMAKVTIRRAIMACMQ